MKYLRSVREYDLYVCENNKDVVWAYKNISKSCMTIKKEPKKPSKRLRHLTNEHVEYAGYYPVSLYAMADRIKLYVVKKGEKYISRFVAYDMCISDTYYHGRGAEQGHTYLFKPDDYPSKGEFGFDGRRNYRRSVVVKPIEIILNDKLYKIMTIPDLMGDEPRCVKFDTRHNVFRLSTYERNGFYEMDCVTRASWVNFWLTSDEVLAHAKALKEDDDWYR